MKRTVCKLIIHDKINNTGYRYRINFNIIMNLRKYETKSCFAGGKKRAQKYLTWKISFKVGGS